MGFQEWWIADRLDEWADRVLKIQEVLGDHPGSSNDEVWLLLDVLAADLSAQAEAVVLM